MQQFRNDLPDSFRAKLAAEVVLMSSTRDKKKNRRNDAPSFNSDLIFARALLLLGTQQIEFDAFFKFELVSVPTSLFQDNGDPHYPQNKSILMNKMKIEVSLRGVHPDSILVDGEGTSANRWVSE